MKLSFIYKNGKTKHSVTNMDKTHWSEVGNLNNKVSIYFQISIYLLHILSKNVIFLKTINKNV